MPYPLRFALVLAALASAALSGARAQVIAVKTAPIADGGQFAFLPSANLGMGGLSIALADSSLDPFVNPAKGARLRGTRVFGAPTFFSVTRKAGGGLTLPLGMSMSGGAWFSELMVAMQDIDRAGNDNPVVSPLASAADSRAPIAASTVVPPIDDSRASRENHFVHGMLGRRLGRGFSVASSASWWRLNALDGVELFYPTSQGVRQHGEASDVRLGVLREFGRGHSLEAVAVHNRFAMNQDVGFNEMLWDPTLRTFTFRSRVEPNASQTSTWGLHLAYLRPIADSTWQVGAVLTGNHIHQPRLPSYDLPAVPADAGRAQAYNVGAGISRSSGPFVIGLEGIYEPIWSRSWVRADEDLDARDGTSIAAGTNVLENRFRFHNGIARLGLAAAMPIAGEHALRLEVGGQLRAIRYRLEQSDAIQVSQSASSQGWNEWTRTWGATYRFAGASLQYRGSLTTGASRNGFDDTGNVVFAPTIDSRPGFASAVPFGLSFAGVRTTTHQISFSVPIR
jgi:hypothetical protein